MWIVCKLYHIRWPYVGNFKVTSGLRVLGRIHSPSPSLGERRRMFWPIRNVLKRTSSRYSAFKAYFKRETFDFESYKNRSAIDYFLAEEILIHWKAWALARSLVCFQCPIWSGIETLIYNKERRQVEKREIKAKMYMRENLMYFDDPFVSVTWAYLFRITWIT